eukprot:scaffold6347_cov124-Isochrysis_galbana.AAC.4
MAALATVWARAEELSARFEPSASGGGAFLHGLVLCRLVQPPNFGLAALPVSLCAGETARNVEGAGIQANWAGMAQPPREEPGTARLDVDAVGARLPPGKGPSPRRCIWG